MSQFSELNQIKSILIIDYFSEGGHQGGAQYIGVYFDPIREVSCDQTPSTLSQRVAESI